MGELFYWALEVLGMKPAHIEDKTKNELYYSKVPDFRITRLLIPIFSFLYVLRHRGKDKDVITTKPFWH